jgi:hypothetical protein
MKPQTLGYGLMLLLVWSVVVGGIGYYIGLSAR